MSMSQILKIRRIPHGTLAVVRYTGVYLVESWDTIADDRSKIDEFEFAGVEDERAARTMAMGCLDSLADQLKEG